MIAREQEQWAGLPLPIKGERLVANESVYGKDLVEKLNKIMSDEEEPPPETGIKLRNEWWSRRLNCRILIYEEGGKLKHGKYWGRPRGQMILRTLGLADAWQLQAEEKALALLQGLVSHQAFRQYLLTGSFLVGSRRSGVCYMFRRLRPTLALSTSGKQLRILCALCLHPLAYYEGSWAGAMVPTDDVVANLILMRGDEHMFWKRSNQHHPLMSEAGLY